MACFRNAFIVSRLFGALHRGVALCESRHACPRAIGAGIPDHAAVGDRLASIRQQRRMSDPGLANTLDNAQMSNEVKVLRRKLTYEDPEKKKLEEKMKSQHRLDAANYLLSNRRRNADTPDSERVGVCTSPTASSQFTDFQESTTPRSTSKDKGQHKQDKNEITKSKSKKKEKVCAACDCGCGCGYLVFPVVICHSFPMHTVLSDTSCDEIVGERASLREFCCLSATHACDVSRTWLTSSRLRYRMAWWGAG